MPTRAPNKSKLTILRADQSSRLPWLVHGFSTRLGGFSRRYGGQNLNLGFTKEDSRAAVERNRAAFLRELGAEIQTRHASRKLANRSAHHHSPNSLRRHSPRGCAPRRTAHGRRTNHRTPGLLLGIQTADCLPVILVDTERHAVGIFHAGWRGTALRIVEKGVGDMHRCFGTRPRDLKAVIGPGIPGCCYEVGEEVRVKFESQFPYAAKLFREVKESDPVREKYPLLFLSARPPGHSDSLHKIFLDLVEANRQQLLAAGVPAKSIEMSPHCTQCRTDLLFSYRAEKGQTGRMMAVVGMQE